MARQIERKLRDGYVELMTLRRLAHPDGRVRELQRRGAEIHEYHGTSAGMRPGTSHGANLADSQSEDEEGKRMAQEIVSRWLQQGFKEQDNPVDRFSEVDLELFGLGRPELLEVPQG